MIGEKAEMIWNPSISHDRFFFLLWFFFVLKRDVVKSIGQIFDTLMKFLFEFIVIMSIIRQSIEILQRKENVVRNVPTECYQRRFCTRRRNSLRRHCHNEKESSRFPSMNNNQIRMEERTTHWIDWFLNVDLFFTAGFRRWSSRCCWGWFFVFNETIHVKKKEKAKKKWRPFFLSFRLVWRFLSSLPFLNERRRGGRLLKFLIGLRVSLEFHEVPESDISPLASSLRQTLRAARRISFWLSRSKMR